MKRKSTPQARSLRRRLAEAGRLLRNDREEGRAADPLRRLLAYAQAKLRVAALRDRLEEGAK